MLVLARGAGLVTGVDGASGQARWSRHLPDQQLPRVDVFTADSSAYLTSAAEDGRGTAVAAIDPDSGSLRWSTRLNGALVPVGAEGGTVVFLSADPVYGRTDGVVSYSAKSGKVQRFSLSTPRQDAWATVRGHVAFILSSDGSLEAVDIGTGKPVWRLQTSVSRGSAPVADDRHVYFSAPDGRLLAVNARNGTLAGQTAPRLSTHADRVPAGLPSPILTPTHVYAAAPDGSVFAVDARDPSAW